MRVVWAAMRLGLAIGWALAVAGCEPTAAECGDGAPTVGVFCFPDEAVVRVGRGFAPAAMAVLDVDGDGALDVAAVNPSRATLSVHWGGADGSLERMTSWPLGQEVAGLAHADLDGDGRADLATALPTSDAVAVLYNRGGREFSLRTHAAGAAPRGLLAARLDADGPAALITANVGDGSVSVLRRGVVGARTIVGAGPQALAAGDLDGDGALDVAVALRGDDAVQVLRNSGGTLITAARHAVGVTPSALVAGDLDGDGKIDLASADRLGDTVSVIFGDGAGGARETSRWPVDRQPSGLVIVRGGGVLPVLGVLSEGTSTAARLDPRSGGLASAATLLPAGAIAAADLDHDGREELLHGAGSGGAIGVMRTGPGLTVTPRWSAAPVGLGCVLDLDGDGVDELVGRRAAGDFTLIADPAAGAAARDWPSGLAKISSCRGVELAGDGREALLIWGEVAEKSDGLTLLRRVGDGWVTQFLVTFAGQQVRSPVVGDAFGDGSIELVVATGSNGDGVKGGLWLLADLTAEAGPSRVLIDERGVRDLVALDLDGDAALDVAGTDGEELLVYRAIGSLEAPRSWTAGSVITALVAGDLDGDGSEDLLLDDGRVLLAPMDPSATIGAATGEGLTPLAVIDLDGDGDLDALSSERMGDDHTVLALMVNDGAAGFTPGGRHALAGGGWRVPLRLADGAIGMAELAPEAVRVLALGVGEALLEQAGVRLDVDEPAEFADLDGDGRLDTYAVGGALAVGFGRTGGFGPSHHAGLDEIGDGASGEAYAAGGDLDGDGAAELVLLRMNLAVPGFPLTALTIARVSADGDFAYEALGSLAGGFSRVFVRDLDADGHADLLLAGRGGSSYLRGRGDGGFDPALTQMGEEREVYPLGLQAIDGDDRLDLLLFGSFGLMVARGQGNGNFDAPRLWWEGFIYARPLVADLNGDRRADLVAPTFSGLTLFAGTAQGLGAGRVLLPIAGAVPALAVADLDGDGSRELLATLRDVEDDVTLLQGRGAGADFVFTPRSLGRHQPLADLRLAVHDLDGDGALDVALVDGQGMTIVRQRP